jgi:integrase
MTWLAHAGPPASGAEAGGAGSAVVFAGPGSEPVRSPSRINAVLTAVRGMVVHAVAAGQAPAGLVPLLYEVADDRDLPEQARGEDGRMAWRMRARHRLHEPETPVERAGDGDIVALLRACRSARDRLIVLLMARAGLRRGEVCGLRRGDVHLLADGRICMWFAGRTTGTGRGPSRAGSAACRWISSRCRRSTPTSSSGWGSRTPR